MSLSQKDVEKVAELSRLKLDDEEKARFARDLAAVLDYMETLNELDVADVEPLAHPLPIQNAFREDKSAPSLPVDDALANAPKRSGDFYSVPPILD